MLKPALREVMPGLTRTLTHWGLNLNFVDGSAFDSRITFTRLLSNATRTNASGLLEVVAADTPRIDYDPVTLACKGLLIEEGRTNSISNNTAVGAVAGTPGTLPTSWQKAEAASLTFNVVGSGIDSGVDYVDIRLSGTASASSTNAIQFSQNSQISAGNGQAWTNSAYLKIVAGSTSGVNSIKLAWEERSGAFLASQASPALTIATTGSFSTCRQSHSATNANASTTFVKPIVQFTPISGQVIDMTIRIGLPQMELGAFATSPIPTTTTSLTRSAELASMTGTNFSSWYNQTEGTFVATSYYQGSSGAYGYSYGASNGTSSNLIGASINNSTLANRLVVIDGGASQVNASSGATTIGAKNTTSCGYKLNDTAFYQNNALVLADTACTIPTVSQLSIGASGGSQNMACCHITSLSYWPVKLSNTELQLLSR